MEQVIPQGQFQLVILCAASQLEAFKKLNLLNEHAIVPDEIIIMDEAEHEYFEVDLHSANIESVIQELIEHGIESDIQVLPLYSDENYTNKVNFNAFTRKNKNGETLSYINSKDEEDLAHELNLLLRELHEHGIHQADTIIFNRMNRLHNIGWVC